MLKMSSAPSYTPPGNIRDKVIVGGAVPKTQQYRGSSIIGPTQSQLQQQLLTAPLTHHNYQHHLNYYKSQRHHKHNHKANQ